MQLSKLGTGIGLSTSASKASPPSSSDKAPLLNGDDNEFEGSGNQIEENSSPAYKFKVSKLKRTIIIKEKVFIRGPDY